MFDLCTFCIKVYANENLIITANFIKNREKMYSIEKIMFRVIFFFVWAITYNSTNLRLLIEALILCFDALFSSQINHLPLIFFHETKKNKIL